MQRRRARLRTCAYRPTAGHRPLTAADVMHAENVAALLRVPVSTIMGWARQGRARKRGRRWLFLRCEIEDWLQRPGTRL